MKGIDEGTIHNLKRKRYRWHRKAKRQVKKEGMKVYLVREAGKRRENEGVSTDCST